MTKNNRKNIVIVIAIAAAIIGGIIFYSEFMSGNRYSVQDYIYEVQFSGNNGEGVVLVPRVNYRAMDSLGFEQAYNLSDVMETVSYTADPYEGLSNGDKVTIKAYYDEAMARNRGIKLTGLTWTVEVQGLEDNQTSYNDTAEQNGTYTNTAENMDNDISGSQDSEYVIGSTYTVQDVLRVRETPDISARQLKRSELASADYANSADYPDALLQKGSRVVCLEMSDNWMRIESGWICVNDGEEVLVK